MQARIKYLKPEQGLSPEDGIDANGVMGWFIGQCTDNSFVGDQLISDPRFIVRDDNGFVDIVFPTYVRFIDTPADNLIRDLLECFDREKPKDEVIKTVNGFFQTEI